MISVQVFDAKKRSSNWDYRMNVKKMKKWVSKRKEKPQSLYRGGSVLSLSDGVKNWKEIEQKSLSAFSRFELTYLSVLIAYLSCWVWFSLTFSKNWLKVSLVDADVVEILLLDPWTRSGLMLAADLLLAPLLLSMRVVAHSSLRWRLKRIEGLHFTFISRRRNHHARAHALGCWSIGNKSPWATGLEPGERTWTGFEDAIHRWKKGRNKFHLVVALLCACEFEGGAAGG